MKITEQHSVADDARLPNGLRCVDADRTLAAILESARLAEGEGARDELDSRLPVPWKLCATVYWPTQFLAAPHQA
jgi:hypothetical protein